jgi:hypothetical protein
MPSQSIIDATIELEADLAKITPYIFELKTYIQEFEEGKGSAYDTFHEVIDGANLALNVCKDIVRVSESIPILDRELHALHFISLFIDGTSLFEDLIVLANEAIPGGQITGKGHLNGNDVFKFIGAVGAVGVDLFFLF